MRTFPWKGALIGFLFGVAGIWILAMLSLALAPLEYLTAPFFLPGRFFASLLIRDGSGSSLESALLFLLSGLFYALVGAGIQLLARRLRRP